MSMFDDIAQVFVDCAGITTAVDRLMELRQQYEALAPTPEMWANASEWAEWSVIHANGLQYWYDTEPFVDHGFTGWNWRGLQNDFCRECELPLGVDWRLCKWQRPA